MRLLVISTFFHCLHSRCCARIQLTCLLCSQFSTNAVKNPNDINDNHSGSIFLNIFGNCNGESVYFSPSADEWDKASCFFVQSPLFKRWYTHKRSFDMNYHIMTNILYFIIICYLSQVIHIYNLTLVYWLSILFSHYICHDVVIHIKWSFMCTLPFK